VDLGVNPNLKVSSVEAAQAIEVLAKNGITLEQVMDGAAEGVIFLANATGADFATSADIATDVMALFGKNANEMIDVVNGITGVTTSSKFSVDDYANAIANGGATLSSMGVPFEDFNTILAGTASRFSSGATAGTAIRNLFQRLVPATDTAREAMQQLGFITEDGTNLFFDANGELESTQEIIGLLSEGFGDLSTEQRAAFAKTIFGQEAMEGLNGVIALGADGFMELSESMASIDAGDAAATRVDNLRGALDILDGVIEAVKLQIGEAFLPALKDLAIAASSFIEENSEGLIKFFEGFAEKVAAVGRGVIEFIDSISSGQGVLSSFFDALAAAGVDEDTVQGYRNFADSVGNIIDIITADDTITEKLANLFAVINEPINTENPTTIQSLSLALGNLFTNVSENEEGATTFTSFLEDLGVSAETANTITEKITGLGEAISGFFDSITDVGGEILEGVFGNLQETIGEEIPEIQAALQGLEQPLDKLKEIFGNLKPAIEGVGAVLGGILAAGIGLAVGLVTGLISAASGIVDTWTALLGTLTGVANGIVMILGGVTEWVKAVWSGDLLAINEAGKMVKEGVIEVFTQLVTGVISILANFASSVWQFLEGFVNGFIGFFEVLYDVLVGNSIVPDMVDAIIGFIADMGIAVLDLVSNTVTGIIDSFTDLIGRMVSVGGDIMQGLLNGLSASRDAVLGFFTSMIQDAINSVWDLLGIDSPSKVFKQIGAFTGEGLAIGLADSAPSVAGGVSAMMAPVEAIAPPASPAQQMTMNVDNSRTVNFTSNNAGNPAINDRSDLMFALAGFG